MRVPTALEGAQYICMYEQRDFGDSAYESNALRFAFKTDVA